ncbi:MAG: Peptidase, family, partial [Gammaproteobacteria bacterium]|nr:Peptidase, family [Gammaproteobacteria bacterium]
MGEFSSLEELSLLPQWYVMQVMPGDTLSGILQRYGVGQSQILAVSKLADAKPLSNLKPGQEMHLLVDADDLGALLYSIDAKNTLAVKQTAVGFEATRNKQPIAEFVLNNTESLQSELTPIMVAVKEVPVAEKVAPIRKAADGSPLADISNKSSLAYVSAEISHSLYMDARKAGLSVKQANQLGKIFATNGVSKKLRKGDRFVVLYEKTAPDGSQKRGDILLAQVSHKGQTYQSIRFVDPKSGKTAYYDAKGMNPEPSLSRTPIRNARLNSTFSHNRLHPILHIRRPHLGVDYGAPTGTPITAAGDGVIAYQGYKGGYGNTVVVKHENRYSTLYGHMSRYAKNIKTGSAVKAGQVIGYVGSTGLASGPHLHYEIHVDNVPKNPLTVALPGTSIPAAHKRIFLAQVKTLLAQLNLNQATQLAKRKDAVKPAAS